jgi:predicted transcriptional regulator
MRNSLQNININKIASSAVMQIFDLKSGINEATILSARVLCEFMGCLQISSSERDILASVISCRGDVPFEKFTLDLKIDRQTLLRSLNRLKSFELINIKVSSKGGLYDATVSLKNKENSIKTA